jgi:PAS domain S-box-containing protein
MGSNGQPAHQLGELILEQTADAIIYSSRQGTIERRNAAPTAIFGYTAPEALGQSLDLINTNPCHPHRTLQPVTKCLIDFFVSVPL